jgi:hypothetical protein
VAPPPQLERAVDRKLVDAGVVVVEVLARPRVSSNLVVAIVTPSDDSRTTSRSYCMWPSARMTRTLSSPLGWMTKLDTFERSGKPIRRSRCPDGPYRSSTGVPFS